MAIAKRLIAAKDAITYSTSGSGPRPQASFCTYATYPDGRTGDVFAFCVSVYLTHATAEIAEGDHQAFVAQQGSPDANQLDVVGPVEFWGYTGGYLPTPNGPRPLPRNEFMATVALALGKR